MKGTIIFSAMFLCLISSAIGSDLSKALFKAGSHIIGSDEWYEALAPFVERTSTNSIGRLTPQGLNAIRAEFSELKVGLLKRDPPLDLTTEFTLGTEALKSDAIRDLPKFLVRLSRICSLVGRLDVDGKLGDTTLMFRCDHLEVFVLHHGVRAYINEEKTQPNVPPLPRAPQTGHSGGER